MTSAHTVRYHVLCILPWLLSGLVSLPARAQSDPMAPPPELKGQVLVRVQPFDMSAERPVPRSGSELVLGHDRSVSPLLGALSVLAGAATNENRKGRGLAGDNLLPMLSLTEPARAELVRQIARLNLTSRFTMMTPEVVVTGRPLLDVRPLGLLSVADSYQQQTIAMLQVRMALTDANGRLLWRTLCTASDPRPRDMQGPNGWTEGGASALKNLMASGLQNCLSFLMEDQASPKPRSQEKVIFKSKVAWSHEDWEIEALVMSQGARYTVLGSVRPIADVRSGFHVIDRLLWEPARLPGLIRKPVTAVATGPAADVLAVTEPTAAAGPELDPQNSAEHILHAADGNATPTSVNLQLARVLKSTDVEGRTWVYPHPRDPSKWGNVRLRFQGGQVDASNSRSKATGRYEQREREVCMWFDSPNWLPFCVGLINPPGQGVDAAPMLLMVRRSVPHPLTIE